MIREARLDVQPAREPGEIILSVTVYPTWTTAVVTVQQAEEFVVRLREAIESARKPQPTDAELDAELAQHAEAGT